VKENMEDARSLGDLFIALRRHPRPVIAAVRGRALAGGCGLAIACDVVLAAESAQFGFPEVNIGFVPAMVSAIVRRSVSEKRAFDLLAGGEPVSARAALDMGLITRVFPDEAFEREVEAYIAGLAEKSASAISLTKSVLAQTDGLSFETAIEAGAHANTQARMTEDCRRGVNAFLSRRLKRRESPGG
jgi:methylglutaconyl-CoA hydratase